MKRAVLFDLFGTLVPSPPAQGYREVVDSIAGIAGIPTGEFFSRWMSVNDGRLNGSFGSSEGEIGHVTGLFGITLSDAQMTESVQLRRDSMTSWLSPKSGCIAMLSELAKSEIKVALVSDCVFDVPTVWPSTLFAEHFAATVFSCVLAARKPDARLYENAMNQLGVSPDDCIFVGDGGSNELQGARELGIDAYFLDDQPADQSKVLRVDVHEWDGPAIKSLSEVSALVETFRNN